MSSNNNANAPEDSHMRVTEDAKNGLAAPDKSQSPQFLAVRMQDISNHEPHQLEEIAENTSEMEASSRGNSRRGSHLFELAALQSFAGIGDGAGRQGRRRNSSSAAERRPESFRNVVTAQHGDKKSKNGDFSQFVDKYDTGDKNFLKSKSGRIATQRSGSVGSDRHHRRNSSSSYVKQKQGRKMSLMNKISTEDREKESRYLDSQGTRLNHNQMKRNSISHKYPMHNPLTEPASGLKQKQRISKAGTLQIKSDDDKKFRAKRGATSTSSFHKKQKNNKSVSHAESPAIISSMSQFSNRLVHELSDDERIMNALEPSPEPVDRRAKLSKQLSVESCSIDGRIEDLDIEDAPKVRKYLERFQDHQKQHELGGNVYSKEEIKEHKSVKSILSRRTQFNNDKQEFLMQLQKRFPVSEHQALTQKDHSAALDKQGRKRTGGIGLNGGEKSRKQEGSWWQRFKKDYQQRMLLINDEVTFDVHGKRFMFSKNSLGFLSNRSPVRIALVWIITWPVFDKLILLLIILNSLGLGLKDYLDPENLTYRNQFIESFDIYFTVAFCIEAALKIMAMGFFLGKGAYLKDAWNWLDFIVVVSSLLEQYISNVSGLRTFRLFRPLRSLNNIKSMQILVETLFRSMMSLGGIMGLAVFLLTIFAILGISQWRGLSHWRCRITEFPVDGDWLPVDGDTQLCFLGNRECEVGYCGSLIDRYDTVGDITVADLYRDSKILELNYGVTNFDHMGYAFLTIFQCITMEGWTTVMYIYEDVAHPVFVVFYFVACVVICSFFLLNLTIAVMLMEYDELEQKNSNSVHKIQLRNMGLDCGLPRHLVEFVIKQSNLTIGKKAKKKLIEIKQKELSLCQKLLATEQIPQPERVGYYSYRVPQVSFAIAKSNAFGIIVMVCIILNTLVLSMDRYPEGSEQEKYVNAIANFIFNVVFTLEVVIKMFGLGLNRYVKNVENLFDFVVVGMSWVEMALGSEGGSSLGALRAVRLFRVFKLFKSGDLRILMDSIVFTVSTIGPYTVLLCLFLYVFALMGMQFFAGQFRFLDHGIGAFDLENGDVPRANFDTLQDALLTTFSCFIGDNWTFVMYDAVRSSGGIYAFYFVFVIAFGNIVMLNLFLAILLGNFDRARDFGGKKKLIMCFVELKEHGIDLSECIDMILEDTAEYIKFSILKWDRRVVKLEKEDPNPFIRDMLEQKSEFMEKFDLELGKNPPQKSDPDDDDEVDVKKSQSSQKRGRRSRQKTLKLEQSSPSSRVDLKQSKRSKTNPPQLRLLTSDDSYTLGLEKPRIKINALETNESPSARRDSSTIKYSNTREFEGTGIVLKHINESHDRSMGTNDSRIQLFPRSSEDKEDHQDKDNGERTSKSATAAANLLLDQEDNLSGNERKTIRTEDDRQNLNLDSAGSQEDQDRQNQLILIQIATQDKFASIDGAGTGRNPAEIDTSRTLLNQKTGKKFDDQVPDLFKTQASQEVAGPDTKISKLSLIQSFTSFFKRNKKNAIHERPVTQMKKVLQPCDYRLRRIQESKDLYKIVQDSQNFVEDPDVNHCLHDPNPQDYSVSHSMHDLHQSAVSFQVQLSSRKSVSPNKSLFSQQSPNKMSRSISPSKLANQRRRKSTENRDSISNLNSIPEEFVERSCWSRACRFMSESSVCIFHRDFKIRKMCIQLLKPPPSIKSPIPNNALDVSPDISPFKLGGKASIVNSKSQISDTDINNSSPKKLSKKQKKKSRSSRKLQISLANANDKTGPKSNKNCCARCCPALYNSSPNKWFDNVILCLIFTSSVMLALDTPLINPNSTEAKIYSLIDMIHTVLFTIEMLIKIIGLGFFSNSLKDPQLQPYIKSTWNTLDFFVVMSSLLELLMPLVTGGSGADSLKSLKALRALRALRPLRMVSKNEGMKLVVGALMTSIPSMTNVLLVCLLLLLILAIVGVNLFKGKFFTCMGLSYALTQTIMDKQGCIDAGGLWANQDINFDNVVNAMTTLFQMLTTEGWMTVMYNGMDATDIDMQPKFNNQPIMATYFVAFMIIGSQFIINLFVGVVIDNFNKIKEADEMGNNFVTQEQRSWIEIQKVCLSKNLAKQIAQPKGYQILFDKLTSHMAFEYTITGCILMNTFCMGMVHYRQPDELTVALEYLNYVFAFVFNVEMTLKLLAQGKNYFSQGWNVFDCFIVIGTNFGILMKLIGTGESMGATTSVIRGFRIMRIFRLVKASISIRLLIDTLMNILPQITNIMGLMLILLFIYAALGLNLFSQVIYQDQLNEKNNFQSFGASMILLMRCATGEDWNLVMYELANKQGYDGVMCREQTYEEQQLEGIIGCGSSISFFYFFSYVILITMLIMNLAVAAVIQGLNTACQENLGIVSADDVDQFISLWKYYDPAATGWISAENLVYLLCELKHPLGRKRDDVKQEQEDFSGNPQTDRYLVQKEKKIVIKKVKGLAMLKDNLKIKMHSDKACGFKVHYGDVLKGLLKRILSEKKQDYKIKGALESKLQNMWTKKHKDLGKQGPKKMKQTAAHLAAVQIIENWFLKKKNAVNKPDTAILLKGDQDRFKEAQKLLSIGRFEREGRLIETIQNKPKVETAKELQNEYEQAETKRAGAEIYKIIKKHDHMYGPKSSVEEKTQVLCKISQDNETRPPNMRKNDTHTWQNSKAADLLYQDVIRDEQYEAKRNNIFECEETSSQGTDAPNKNDVEGDQMAIALGPKSLTRNSSDSHIKTQQLSRKLQVQADSLQSMKLSAQEGPISSRQRSKSKPISKPTLSKSSSDIDFAASSLRQEQQVEESDSPAGKGITRQEKGLLIPLAQLTAGKGKSANLRAGGGDITPSFIKKKDGSNDDSSNP